MMLVLMKIFIYVVFFLQYYVVLHYNATDVPEFVKLSIEAISLGHSGFLITWKPSSIIENENEESILYSIGFETNMIEEKNEDDCKHNDCQNFTGTIRKYQVTDYGHYGLRGSYKIHSLYENTLYEVIVRQRKWESNLEKHYSVKKRTAVKSNRTPAKPSFDWSFIYVESDSVPLSMLFKWHPCGRESDCHNQEGGTHFGIKFKELHNTRKSSEVKMEEFYTDYKQIFLLPARMYEVVVYSINGEFQTDSDSENIYLQPVSSPVQCVQIITLPDLSIFISWKLPKESLIESSSAKSSGILIVDSSKSNANEQRNVFSSNDSFRVVNNEIDFPGPTSTIRIRHLTPNVKYILTILPFGFHGFGFEYQMIFELQFHNHNLPIAKPDFIHAYVSSGSEDKCSLIFQWLPCGQSFNCENTKPGSDYIFQIKLAEVMMKNSSSQGNGVYRATFKFDLEYEVTLRSSIKDSFSRVVTKKFKNCTEI